MRIYFMGICGTAMGNAALLARAAGHEVMGADSGVYPPMSNVLAAAGITLHEGYDPVRLEKLAPELVVVGNAMSRGNAEVEWLLDTRAIPFVSLPAFLYDAVLSVRKNIVIAGTHGKTTTTALTAFLLRENGRDPGFLIGGVPLDPPVGNHLGTAGDPFVIEGDEYDSAFFDKRSKFIHYAPHIAVLNNLEFDHADIFDDIAAIERQFHHLVRTVPSSGRLVVNAREEALQRVLAMGCWSEVVRFGARKEAPGELRARGEPHAFDVLRGSLKIARVEWSQLGEHNQMNALAAIAAAEHVGVAPGAPAAALARFENVRRRMELIGSVKVGNGEIRVYDDFAHHPTAMRTTVNGLRRKIDAQQSSHHEPRQRILAVFEPRSNTMKLGAMKALLPWSLEEADLAFCHSGGLTWDAVQALAPMGQQAVVADTIDKLVTRVVAAAKPGDHILCMSNGGFGGIHQKLMDALAKKA